MFGTAKHVLAGAILALWSGAALAQNFLSQGPGPRSGPINVEQSGDATPNGSEAGAIQAVLPDPALGSNTIFAGSTNGGVWVTTNGGAKWTPLTDNQASLSIANLTLDPTDTTGKTIVAGIGITDNGDYDQFNTPYQGRGGPRTGLLYTTDGGASWRALGGATLANQSVIDAAARGNTILAATFEEQATTVTKTAGGARYGLYRSVDGGASFSLVRAGSGLPHGPVTSLAGDPADPSRFYAAITSPTNPRRTGVYISNNTGATWAPVFTAADSHGAINPFAQTVITLASGPDGSIAVALSNIFPALQFSAFAGLFLSKDSGATWHRLGAAPDVVPGGQTPVNLHIAIDPTNANIVYLTGDAYQTCGGSPPTSACTVEAFRVVFNPSNNRSSAASLTIEGTAARNFNNANTAHADSRALAFTPAGGLIMTSDGGIYLRNHPKGNGAWQGLNGNLAAFEPYAVAYDANSKRIALAAQDDGVSLQAIPGAPLFKPINFGDGTNATINDQTLKGLSAVYSSSQSLGGLSRMIINSQGLAVSPFPDPTNPGGVPITCNGKDCGTVTNANFSSPFVLNRIDPTGIAIGGGSDVFVTQDPLTDAAGVNATSVNLSLVNVGVTGGPSVIAYGTRDNTKALLVGGANAALFGPIGGVWRSSTAARGSLAQLTNYPGLTPTDVVYDPRAQARFFVADGRNLWGITNGTAAAKSVAFTPLTADLPAGFIRPTATEFISNNGVNALLVGGLSAPLSCTTAPDGCVIAGTQSPITVADSNAQGQLSGWRAFGQELPNTLIEELAYNPTVDVLTAGLVGRGAWVLYDATSLFPQARILKFGLADNNSTPDAALLTDGTVGSRPLIKYGTGTLTIAGTASYTGNTTIDDGTLRLGAGGASGSILGNVTFCTSAADPLCNATENKFLVVDRSDAYTFGGLIAGLGQLVQEGSGTLSLTGNSGGFLGTALVAGGALVIGPGARLGGSVTVENGAIVAGYGTIGGALANPSGIVMPGGSIGTLSVGGNYLQGNNSTLLSLLGPGAASLLAVGGKASLAGTLDLAAAPGAGPAPFGNMVILTAGRGVIGTFGQVMDLTILPARIQYTADAVDVQLGGFAGGPGNTAAIVSALNAAVPTATGDFAAALGLALRLPAAQLQETLASFGGPIYGNLAQVSLADRRLFLGAMDRRIGRLGGDAPAGANEGGLGGIPGPWGRGGNAMQLAALGEAIDDAGGAAAGEPGTAAPQLTNLWARGFGQFGSIGNSGVALGSNYSTGGGTIGADLIRAPDSLFGIAVGGGQSSLSVNTLPENGTIGFVQLGAYGAHALGRGFAVDGAGILAHDFYDVSRGIVLPGPPRAATSSHGGNDVVADVGLSRPFLADEWQVTPRAGIAYFHIGQSVFSESGAGGLDLAVTPNALDAMFSRVGVTIARPMASGDTDLRPEIRLAWTHNFLDTADSFGASFIGAGAGGFGQVGPAVGRDAAELGVGLSFAVPQDAVPGRMSGFVHYDATLAAHETANAFAAGLRLDW